MPDYFNNNWSTLLDDTHGNTWCFMYNGGSSIRIRPLGSGSGNWTHQILLDYENKRPADVTDEWLTARAAEWIADRTDDPAETRTVA